MRLPFGGGLDLTYCTNIHPGHGWAGVFDQLKKYAPELKRRLSPEMPFALGLRLSNQESVELAEPGVLSKFSEFLADQGLYVAVINGFPFGSFHRTVVKEQVFAPDWADERRLDYTIRLARIVNKLLPSGMDGGVSTIPLSYKPWGQEPARIAAQLLRAADELWKLEQETGRFVHIDIEPEPNGMVETTAEVLAFFDQYLAAERARRYLGVCFDTCHMAVEYEDIPAAIKRLRAANIAIGRIQISSALQVDSPATAAGELRAFAESTYLHQVIARLSGGVLRRYPDLGAALEEIDDPAVSEWRVHFHVPIFLEWYGGLGSTQTQIREALAVAAGGGVTTHLEIETYTWEVLPPEWKQDLGSSIAREFEWLREALNDAA